MKTLKFIALWIIGFLMGCSFQKFTSNVEHKPQTKVDSLYIYQVRFEGLTSELIKKYGNPSNEWSKEEKLLWGITYNNFQRFGGYTELIKRGELK